MAVRVYQQVEPLKYRQQPHLVAAPTKCASIISMHLQRALTSAAHEASNVSVFTERTTESFNESRIDQTQLRRHHRRIPISINPGSDNGGLMIDQQTKDALREVLLADERVWAGKLDDLLESFRCNPMQVVRIRRFLKDRIGVAGSSHIARLEAMSEHIGAAIESMDPQEALLNQLAERILVLNAKRQEIDSELADAKQLLVALIGESNVVRSARFQVKTTRPGWSLRILEKQKIPAQWLSPQPDRRAILQHYKRTGEIIPGASIAPRQPSVYLSEIEPEVDG